MNSRQLLLIVIAIIVVVGLAFFVRSHQFSGRTGTGSQTGNSGAGGESGSATRTSAPSDAVVPEQGATSVPANVAPPTLVTAAAPGVPYSYRSFGIAVQNGKFVPDTVIVNEGDTVHLNLTAADGAYDFYQPDYGLSSTLPKGQTKIVEFGATLSGKLTFYCKSCGGPNQGPVGYIVVVPKK